MKNIKLFIALLTASTLGLTACTNSDDSDKTTFNNEYRNGILVLNEGAYGRSNASITFYKEGVASQNIFKTVNPTKTVGNVAQDILVKEGKAYIVVNGSNKIEIVDASTFVSEATITSELSNPRYIAIDEQNIYVSNWGDPSVSTDDYIAVFRRADNALVNKIDVKEGPDRLILKNNKLVITHSGGWSNGNSVSILNTRNNKLENFFVGDIPNDLAVNNNDVYVLCSGITYDGETGGKLVQINLNTNEITQTLDFNSNQHPGYITIYNNEIYYNLGNTIYKAPTNPTSLPENALFTANATYLYGFTITNNAIYIADAKDFTSNGEVKYYSLTGSLLGSFATGIGPNTIIYN